MEDALLKAVRELPMAEPPEVEVGDGTATMTWPLVDGWEVVAVFDGKDHGEIVIHYVDPEGGEWDTGKMWPFARTKHVEVIDFERHLESLRWLVTLLIEMADEAMEATAQSVDDVLMLGETTIPRGGVES